MISKRSGPARHSCHLNWPELLEGMPPNYGRVVAPLRGPVAALQERSPLTDGPLWAGHVELQVDFASGGKADP